MTSVFLLLLASVNTSGATTLPVRGGSHYGSNDPTTFNNGSAFNDCLTGQVQLACEAFTSAPISTTVVNGQTYGIRQFVFGNTNIQGTVFDIIDLGSIAPNTTFSLPLAFFTPGATQVFTCGDGSFGGDPLSGSTSIFDTGGATGFGPCTPGLTAIPDISTNGVSFATGPNFNVSDLVLDSPVPVSTPEPSSIVLLGVGLLAVGRKFRCTR
jgi:hypothetical protein